MSESMGLAIEAAKKRGLNCMQVVIHMKAAGIRRPQILDTLRGHFPIFELQ